jgi:hypothetical protein
MAGAAEQAALVRTRHFSLVAGCDKQWAYAGLMPPRSRQRDNGVPKAGAYAWPELAFGAAPVLREIPSGVRPASRR